MELEYCQFYTREEILAAFDHPERTNAEGWYLASQGLVGLFSVGYQPPEIHFCNLGRFHWYGQKEEDVPEPIKAFKELDGGYLFIQSPIDGRYAFVSNIKHVGMHGGTPCQAAMDISPRVPYKLLHQLGGLYIHPDGEEAMNKPVASLRVAKTAGERFAAFQEFVEVWRGPLEPSQALTDADIAKANLPIPGILERFYRWAGACDDVRHAGYMTIRKPEELAVYENDYVAFCVECQWCGNYFLKLDEMETEDPEVYSDECGDNRGGAGYRGTGIGISKFLWAYFIAKGAASGPVSRRVYTSRVAFRELSEAIDPLPVLASGCRSNYAIQAYRPKIRKRDRAIVFAQDGVMGYFTKQEKSPCLELRSKSDAAIERLAAKLGINPMLFCEK